MFLGITFKQSILSQICTIFSKRMTDTSKYTKIRYSLVYVYGVIIVKKVVCSPNTYTLHGLIHATFCGILIRTRTAAHLSTLDMQVQRWGYAGGVAKINYVLYSVYTMHILYGMYSTVFSILINNNK